MAARNIVKIVETQTLDENIVNLQGFTAKQRKKKQSDSVALVHVYDWFGFD